MLYMVALMASYCTRGSFTLRRGQYLLFPGTILWWKEWRNERVKNKAFHAQISAPCDPCQRIFSVNQLPLEVIILTCPGYKRSNRHVDLALIIINYESLSFLIPPRALTLITVDPCDGSLLVEAYDDERQISDLSSEIIGILNIAHPAFYKVSIIIFVIIWIMDVCPAIIFIC